MGAIFFVEEERKTPEELQAEEEEIEALANMYRELGKIADKSEMPDFLKTPQINEEFGENYRIVGASTDPVVHSVYRLKKYYTDYWKYIDAIDIYDRYLEYLENAYGNIEIILISAKHGTGKVFVPDEPKLMNKKANKKLVKSGMVYSRMVEGVGYDTESLLAAIDRLPKRELCDDEDYEPPKRIKKLYEKEIMHKTRSERVNNMLSVNSTDPNKQGSDAIIQFIMSETSNPASNVQKRRPLTELMEEEHINDYIPDEILEDAIMPHIAGIRSDFLVDPKAQAQKDILMALVKNGWNFLNSAGARAMDEDTVRAVKRSCFDDSNVDDIEIDYENMSKKQIKKLKKKRAKRERRAKQRMIGDRRLRESLLANRINLSKSNITHEEFINFRFADCFKDM